MKFVAKLLLAIFFIPIFLVAIVTGTAKFQLLDVKFWQVTFTKYDVYQSLATVLRNNLDDKINSSGGNVSDVKVITDLITSGNLKDLIDKNVVNILGYANGKAADWNVYVPINKIPRSLLPDNLLGMQDSMPISLLLTKFDVSPGSFDYKGVSQFGRSVNLLFFGSVFLILLFTVLLILLTKSGKRFTFLGITYLISGLLTIVLYRLIIFANLSMADGMSQTTTIGDMIARILLPPVIQEAIGVWIWIGIVVFAAGMIFIFVRKPDFNLKKNLTR